MFNFLANVLSSLGMMADEAGSQACVAFFVDEPEMPACLIK